MSADNHLDLYKLNKLWETVFGHTINGTRTPGLVEQMGKVMPIILTLQKVVVVLKWATITFTGAILVGLANLITIAS